jgi:hypothetical protein
MSMVPDKETALDFTRTPEETRLLLAYRAADDAGKRRITRLLKAAARGLLPPAGLPNTPEEIDAFLDSLPELQS